MTPDAPAVARALERIGVGLHKAWEWAASFPLESDLSADQAAANDLYHAVETCDVDLATLRAALAEREGEIARLRGELGQHAECAGPQRWGELFDKVADERDALRRERDALREALDDARRVLGRAETAVGNERRNNPAFDTHRALIADLTQTRQACERALAAAPEGT